MKLCFLSRRRSLDPITERKKKKQITNQQFIKLASDNSRSLAHHDDALVSDGSESIKREQQKKKMKKKHPKRNKTCGGGGGECPFHFAQSPRPAGRPTRANQFCGAAALPVSSDTLLISPTTKELNTTRPKNTSDARSSTNRW